MASVNQQTSDSNIFMNSDPSLSEQLLSSPSEEEMKPMERGWFGRCCAKCCGGQDSRWVRFQRSKPHLSRLIFYTIVMFVLAYIGGAIFRLCEYHHEKGLIARRAQLYGNLTAALNGTLSDKLDELITLSSVPTSNHNNRWAINRSAFFAFTTASTIGYGFTAPVTVIGRIFVVLYGLPAIMVFGVVMYNVGSVIQHYIDWSLKKRQKHGKFAKWMAQYISFEGRRTITVFIALVLEMIIGALVLFVTEHWSMAKGMYFMWVSMSTIGYGDIEPSNAIGEASIVANIWIYIGLATAAVLISSGQDWMAERLKQVRYEETREERRARRKKEQEVKAKKQAHHHNILATTASSMAMGGSDQALVTSSVAVADGDDDDDVSLL